MTAVMPLTSRTHGACSLLDPHPKFARVIMTLFPAQSAGPEKLGNFRSSRIWGFNASFETSVRYFAGIISSVLISDLSRNNTRPEKFFIYTFLTDISWDR